MVQNDAIANSDSLYCAEKLAEAAVLKEAFYLPESKAFQLNKALNEHNAVRLKPNGDYTRAFTIKMKSNQSLYGLAATKVPDIIIAPGAENVIVSDIHNRKITFPESDLVTAGNCFNRIRTSIEITNAKLENNLFTDFQGGIVNIDNSKHGYIRNNRFIKTMTHTAWPALTIRGNIKEPSYGNHFVWTNILGPLGDSVVIDRQKNIAFTGIDVESWSWGDQVQEEVPIYYPAAINVSNTDFLSIFMSHGGNHRIKEAQFYNLDAKNIFLQGSFVEKQTVPGLILGANVEAILAINTRKIGHKAASGNTQVIEIYKDNKPQVISNWRITKSNQLDPASLLAANNILQKEHNVYENWEKPVFRETNYPVSMVLKEKPKIFKNASETIQTLVDSENIAELEEGIYYLSKPIELKNGQGLVGAGQNKTFLVANDNSIDLIVGATHLDNQLKSTWFVLADLSLQGGRNGINHAPAGSGMGAQYHRSVLSHLTFRDMGNAAIMLDSIYGWDNNYLDNINFINCGAGIKQRPSASYKGGDVPGTTYMDKNVCYRCRFEDNDIALDLPGKRGNGLNAFIDSQFKNNGRIIKAIHPLSNFFANSTFVNNKGDPSIETNKSLGFVHSEFIWAVPGSIFQRYTLCNGCTFDMQHPGASIISNQKNRKAELNFFVNGSVDRSISKSIYSGLVLKNPAEISGLFIDNNRTTMLFKSEESN